MLVVGFINFVVTNKVPQVSFKIATGDLISFNIFGSDMELFGSDMILFRSDMILLGSMFQVHEFSVLLVASLINFGVTNQVPQVSFKIVAGDLISIHSFGSDLFSDLTIFGSGFNIQELSVLLEAALTNFGVKNQVPQFFFKFSCWGFGVSFLL